MGFVKGDGKLVGANMKKNGTLLIQIEVSGELASAGDYARLRKMMNGDIDFALDGQVVKYAVPVYAKTQDPVTTYTIDSQGVLIDVKQEGEQLELDLNVPRKKEPIENIPEEISREVVDEFILSGLAPQPKGFYPLQDWIARHQRGESYQMIGSYQGMNSGKIIDLIDEYRQTCAPMAAAWDEWRQNGGTAAADDDQSEDEADDQEETEEGETDPVDHDSGDDIVLEGEEKESSPGAEEELNDWEKEIMGETDQPPVNESEPAAEDLDEYILQEKPVFEDIPYDYPTILVQRLQGKSWLDIGRNMGVNSEKLQRGWTKYRKRVKEQRNGGVA